MATRTVRAWDWLDPAVEAEMLKPRGRGRPPRDVDSLRWAACLRVHRNRFAPYGERAHAVNREVLASQIEDLSAQRRATLDAVRSNPRDEDRRHRRGLIAGLVAMHPKKSAAWIASWIKRTSQKVPELDLSMRTLRGDIAAMRKSGNARPR